MDGRDIRVRITEENVVQQIKEKNEEGINYILQAYGGLLHAIIRKYLQGNQPDIEECLSDTLVSVWFHIHSFDPEKNEFKQWIAAIAKYKAIDYVRKSEKEKQQIRQFKLNEQASAQTVSDPCMSDMNQLLNELSDVEQAIFQKYYFEGFPSKEIATQFQAKESWVHNKLSRGRKKLRNILLNDEV